MVDDAKPDSGERTETTVRQYDTRGELVAEVTTTVVKAVPPPGEDNWPGQYL